MRSPVIAAIHSITTKRTTTIDHQVTNQKELRQAVQFPLQQKNHHAPDFNAVAPGLCTVVFLPAHQLQIEYSLTSFSLIRASAWDPLYQKI